MVAEPLAVPAAPRMKKLPDSSENLLGLKRSEIFYAKRQRSLQGSRPEVPGDSTLSRRVSCPPDVSLPCCLSKRLLRLGKPQTMSSCHG
jgi:hypothetical protein